MDLKYTFLILIALLSFTVVSAAPPVQESIIIQFGIDIEAPMIGTQIVGQDFKYHIHAHNVTTGLLMTNETTNCIIHIYTPVDGGHIIEDDMGFDDNLIDFDYLVEGGNFTRPGQYAVLFYCEDLQGEIGGFLEYAFEVIGEGGYALSSGMAILYIGLLLMAIALFAFSFYWAMRIKFGNLYDSLGEGIISINWLKYLKLFLVPICYVILLFIFGLARSIAANYLQIAGLESFFNWTYWLMMGIAYPLTIFGLYIFLIVALTDKKIMNALKRGDPANL